MEFCQSGKVGILIFLLVLLKLCGAPETEPVGATESKV